MKLNILTVINDEIYPKNLQMSLTLARKYQLNLRTERSLPPRPAP
jgi:hypothetical protein